MLSRKAGEPTLEWMKPTCLGGPGNVDDRNGLISKLALDISLDSSRNCVPGHGSSGTTQLELPIRYNE